MMRVVGIGPALLAELDFEGRRVFPRPHNPHKRANEIAHMPVAQPLPGPYRPRRPAARPTPPLWPLWHPFHRQPTIGPVGLEPALLLNHLIFEGGSGWSEADRHSLRNSSLKGVVSFLVRTTPTNAQPRSPICPWRSTCPAPSAIAERQRGQPRLCGLYGIRFSDTCLERLSRR